VWTFLPPRFDRHPARRVRRNPPATPLARSETHLKLGTFPTVEFKARLEVEAGFFVDWQRGRIGPRGASWRAFRALAFVIADRGSGPDSAERATLPRKRSDARIAVNRRA
jgi:hypothetical protein